MNYTAITPTGDRHFQMSLCEEYISRQTIPPSQWIVVDDGNDPMTPTDNMDYIRRNRQRGDHIHTLKLNMLEALDRIENEICIIFEDDDWYHPEYAEFVLNNFGNHNMVGQGKTWYYNVVSKTYFRHRNVAHASWCQTSFRTEIIVPHIKRICRAIPKTASLDLEIWRDRHVPGKYVLPSDPPYTIGIKGIRQGRPGQSVWHRPLRRGHGADKDGKLLYELIGDDAKRYD